MAGSGERFLSPTPKQFLLMGGHPLFGYAARVLNDSHDIDFLVYVVPTGYLETAEKRIKEEKLEKKHAIIEGGATRGASAYAAVKFLIGQGAKADAVVLLQDGDRPNLTAKLIRENIMVASRFKAAVTALPSYDSVAISKEPSLIDGYLPREEVYLLQTPQAFQLSLLNEAFLKAKAEKKVFTDEGSLVLALMGVAPHIVIGAKNNVKITEPEDAVALARGLKK